jgi:hypothetical protein
MVSVNVSEEAPAAVLIVSVELAPLGVGMTEVGTKLPLAPEGSPVTDSETGEVKPLLAVSVTV